MKDVQIKSAVDVAAPITEAAPGEAMARVKALQDAEEAKIAANPAVDPRDLKNPDTAKYRKPGGAEMTIGNSTMTRVDL